MLTVSKRDTVSCALYREVNLRTSCEPENTTREFEMKSHTDRKNV
jgi:hypothetical protein